MTVSYTSEVATAQKFGIFWKLLFRWKGSIYKLIWPEFIIYLMLYYSIRFVYIYALDEAQRGIFEGIALYCQHYSDLIPLTFVLGFYVNIVMQRWWDQYRMLPWPDNMAVFVSTSIQGHDDRGRLMRRTVMRYVNLAFVMTLSMISPKVKKRFPTREHLIEAGFLTKNEEEVFDHLDELYPNPKNWMPLVWAGTVVTRARKEGRIRDDFAVKTLLDTINAFRQNCGGLLGYDKMSIPLVYTQVVTMAVYTFFFGTLMARQYLDPEKGYPKNPADLYFPWFSILQFIFYMGWLKVAETLVNPFGEDDDDFDINTLIDRNLQISYLIVDGMHTEHPEMVQDKYWEEGIPQSLPYTVATEQYRRGQHLGSTCNMEIPQSHQFFVRTADPLAGSVADSETGLCTPKFRRKKEENENEPDAKLKKLTSIEEDKDEDTDESDGESSLWITPSDIPRNQSILSMIRAQMGFNQISHRRLSRKESQNATDIGRSDSSVYRAFAKKTKVVRSVSKKSNNSPLPMKKTGTESSIQGMFHLSLESLRETTKEDEDQGLTFTKETNKADGIQKKENSKEEDTKDTKNKTDKTSIL